MSRKKIVAGNWKMNMTIDESNDLINELKEVSENNVEINGKLYSFKHISDSGSAMTKFFCPYCGSLMFGKNSSKEKLYH